MSPEDPPKQPLLEEPAEPQMCEVCFSTSHRTEDCDVTREGVMLKNMQWAEESLNSGGLRSERITQSEGLTVYRIYDENGGVLGELEIADEPRALQPGGSKAGSPWGLLSFGFESPDGASYKTGPSGSPYIEDILSAGVGFLREQQERQAAERKMRVRDEFGKLELDGSRWRMSLPGYEHMSSGERAAVLGLTLEEFRESERTSMDLGAIWGELKTNATQNDLYRLWNAWREGGENAAVAELEGRVRALLSPQYLSLLDRVKAAVPQEKNIEEKMEAHRLAGEAQFLGIPREDIDFVERTVDDARSLQFALKEDERARVREWWGRLAKPPEIHIPSFDEERKRLGLESVPDEALEQQLQEGMDDPKRAALQALKDRLARYRDIKQKVIEGTK